MFILRTLYAGTVVAWSGKGMYENCCDSGETMPSYYLDTLGSGAYAGDWDFARFTPDAVVRQWTPAVAFLHAVSDTLKRAKYVCKVDAGHCFDYFLVMPCPTTSASADHQLGN